MVVLSYSLEPNGSILTAIFVQQIAQFTTGHLLWCNLRGVLVGRCGEAVGGFRIASEHSIAHILIIIAHDASAAIAVISLTITGITRYLATLAVTCHRSCNVAVDENGCSSSGHVTAENSAGIPIRCCHRTLVAQTFHCNCSSTV